MKIGVAQSRPVKGDVQTNLVNHLQLVELAASCGADIIVFPELSLTGYEPGLAKELATTVDDSRLEVLQETSDLRNIIVAAGMPVKSSQGVLIAMIIFLPGRARQVYYKQYLHADELPYFVPGQPQVVLADVNERIAMSVCYEIAVPAHVAKAHEHGAEIYIASVAKSVAGVEKAIDTLANHATKYSMTVLMSNCVGPCDNFESGGRSSVWNNKGLLAAQLNSTDEGVLIIDTNTQALTQLTK